MWDNFATTLQVFEAKYGRKPGGSSVGSPQNFFDPLVMAKKQVRSKGKWECPDAVMFENLEVSHTPRKKKREEKKNKKKRKKKNKKKHTQFRQASVSSM